jgi:hypothetical protein
VAVAALIVVHLVPLMLGALTRATPALTGAVLCLAVWRLLPRGAASEPAPADGPPPSSGMSWALALAVAGAAAIAVVGYVAAVATLAFTQVDVVAFHLPGVARWIQTGSVWQIDQFLPYQAQANYPNSGDLVALAVVLPWHDDFGLRFVALPFVAATGVAVYAIGRELGAPAAAAVIYGAVAVTIPSVAVSALDFELPDAIMYSTFATGVLFLLRRARGGGTLDVVLAGIALGVAFGVKWYAVWAVAVVVAVWAAGSLLARRPWRAVGLDGARLAGLIALFGGFWLLRNLVESGNPFFPARVAPLGVTVFDAPYDRYRALAGFPLSDYLDDPSVLRHYALPAFNRTLGLAWVVAATGALVAAAVALRGRRPDWRVVAVGACAALLAVAYLITPYSALGGKGAPTGVAANTRYVVPALLLAAAATAWAAGRGRGLAIAVQLAGALAVADGIRRGFDPVHARHALLAAGFLVAGAAAAAAWRRWGAGARRVPLAAAVAVLGLAVVATAGYGVQRRFNDHRYQSLEAPLAWVREDRHHRVGLAGLWDVDGIYPVLPSFGPRLGNQVRFVGPFRDGMLSEYGDRDSFVAALRRGRYDLLVVGHAVLPGTRPRANEAWARAAGYVVVARSPRLVLLRRPGTPR